MPPLPQGFVPPNLPPLGVPPPMGLPPLGVHPPVSSILGQPLIGAIPPPVSMAPNMPNRGLSKFHFLQLNMSLSFWFGVYISLESMILVSDVCVIFCSVMSQNYVVRDTHILASLLTSNYYNSPAQFVTSITARDTIHK